MEKVKAFYTQKNFSSLDSFAHRNFAVLNFSPVRVNMLFFNIDIPMFYGIIAVGLIGFICGYVMRGENSLKNQD